MANIIQKKRFAGEVKLLQREPLHYVTAYPDKENELIWYFLIKGQKGTDFEGGEYIGKIEHSPKYPAEPPSYMMLTPSGRYEINRKICLTNSNFHRGDWNAMWNIKTILIGFYSIFLDDGATGIAHIHESKEKRCDYAMNSVSYNNKYLYEIFSKFDHNNLFDDVPKKEVNYEENIMNRLNEYNKIIEDINKEIFIINNFIKI